MRYTIKLADPCHDLRAVCGTFGSFAPHIERYYPTAAKWFVETVVPEFKMRKRQVWIAEANSQRVAITISKHDLIREARAKVCTLFVDPMFRRMGIGEALLTRLLEWHDEKMFMSLSIRCPTSVQVMLEPLLVRHGFVCEKELRPIALSSHYEVSFLRTNPLGKTSRRLLTASPLPGATWS